MNQASAWYLQVSPSSLKKAILADSCCKINADGKAVCGETGQILCPESYRVRKGGRRSNYSKNKKSGNK